MELRDYYGNVAFHIVGDRCYDVYNRLVYVLRGNYLCDASGNWQLAIHGDRVYDTQNNWVYIIQQVQNHAAYNQPAQQNTYNPPPSPAYNQSSSQSTYSLGFLQGPSGRILVTAVSIVVIWGLLFLALLVDFMPLGLLVIAICVYFGWGALNRFEHTAFAGFIIMLPLAGWGIYFLIKFFVAVVIGMFVAPFVLGRRVGESFQHHINNQ